MIIFILQTLLSAYLVMAALIYIVVHRHPDKKSICDHLRLFCRALIWPLHMDEIDAVCNPDDNLPDDEY